MALNMNCMVPWTTEYSRGDIVPAVGAQALSCEQLPLLSVAMFFKCSHCPARKPMRCRRSTDISESLYRRAVCVSEPSWKQSSWPGHANPADIVWIRHELSLLSPACISDFWVKWNKCCYLKPLTLRIILLLYSWNSSTLCVLSGKAFPTLPCDHTHNSPIFVWYIQNFIFLISVFL